MDLMKLHEFLKLAKSRNYRKTAVELGISHSTLTRHILELEQELGTPLFSRSTRAVVLTEAGEAYIPYAKHILDTQAEAMRELTRVQRDKQFKLNVNIVSALERYGLMERIASFQKVQSNVHVEIVETSDPKKLLLNGTCNFVFAPANSFFGNQISSEIIERDVMQVVLSRSHPLAKAKSIRFDDLRNEDFILHRPSPDETESQEELVGRLAKAAGFTPKIRYMLSYTSTILRLVSRGEGITILNRRFIPVGSHDVTVVDIDPPVRYDICLYYQENMDRSPATEQFLDFFSRPESSRGEHW